MYLWACFMSLEARRRGQMYLSHEHNYMSYEPQYMSHGNPTI